MLTSIEGWLSARVGILPKATFGGSGGLTRDRFSSFLR